MPFHSHSSSFVEGTPKQGFSQNQMQQGSRTDEKGGKLYTRKSHATRNTPVSTYQWDTDSEDITYLHQQPTQWRRPTLLGRISSGMVEFAHQSFSFLGGEMPQTASSGLKPVPSNNHSSRRALWDAQKAHKDFDPKQLLKLGSPRFWRQVIANIFQAERLRKVFISLICCILSLATIFCLTSMFLPGFKKAYQVRLPKRTSYPSTNLGYSEMQLQKLSDENAQLLESITRLQQLIQIIERSTTKELAMYKSELEKLSATCLTKTDYYNNIESTFAQRESKLLDQVEGKITNTSASDKALHSKLPTLIADYWDNNHAKYFRDMQKELFQMSAEVQNLSNMQTKTELQLNEKANELETYLKNVNNTSKDALQIGEVAELVISKLSDDSAQDVEKGQWSDKLVFDNYNKKVDELYKYVFLDGSGELNWASEALGARIVHASTSPALNTDKWFESILYKMVDLLPTDKFYQILQPMGKPPETVIRSEYQQPGQCFSFEGHSGNITINLPATILLTSVTIEHISRQINYSPDSTPRIFSIYGTPNAKWPNSFEDILGTPSVGQVCTDDLCILSKQYEKMKKKWADTPLPDSIAMLKDASFDYINRMQAFNVPVSLPINRITFAITDNYGGSYTCVYKIRVHGKKMRRREFGSETTK